MSAATRSTTGRGVALDQSLHVLAVLGCERQVSLPGLSDELRIFHCRINAVRVMR